MPSNLNSPQNGSEPDPLSSLGRALKDVSATGIAPVIRELAESLDAEQDEMKIQGIAAAQFLLQQVQKLKKGTFDMDAAIAKQDALQRGYEYVGKHPFIGGFDAVRQAMMKTFEWIDREAQKRTEGQRDADAHVIVKQKESKTIEQIQEELLLQEIAARGMLSSNVSINEKLGEKKGFIGNSGGFQYITSIPGRMEGSLRSEIDAAQMALQVGQLESGMEALNITAAVGIEPVVRKEPIYQTPPPPPPKKGFFNKLFASNEAPKPQLVGYKDVPVLLAEYSQKPGDTEQAYRINIVIIGNDKDPYRDPATNRTGNKWYASLVLPQSLAKKAYTAIQADPSQALAILQKTDPDLYDCEKPVMPPIKSMVVMPEGDPNQAFERDSSHRTTGIKPQYIKPVKQIP